MTKNKSYLELLELPSYEERLRYLMLNGSVGEETFGDNRYLNQALYHSLEWREFRNEIITRENGCDLGIPGLYIPSRAIVHHINPITIEDVINCAPCVFDRNNVILVSKKTHDMIHYSPKVDERNWQFAERKPGDTRLW